MKYRPPAEGHSDGVTVRNDTGVFEGGEISIYYDPMIAKLVTNAGDRLTAIEAQARALDAFYIDGIRHNIPFLASLMQHERWRKGALSTGFIAEEYPDGFAPLVAEGETAHAMAAVAAAVDHVANERKRQISGQMRTQRPVKFQSARAPCISARSTSISRSYGRRGHPCPVSRRPRAPSGIRMDARRTGLERHDRRRTDRRADQADPERLFHRPSRRVGRRPRFHARRGRLAALMPEKKGADRSQNAALPDAGPRQGDQREGRQEVKAGEALCMVEAMKMENVLRAERDVTIKKINAKEGELARRRRGHHGIRLSGPTASRSPDRAAGGDQRAFVQFSASHID